MNNRLFCYGTLQDSRVFATVTGGRPEYQAATLNGFARYKVRNADYPGICRAVDSQVDGLLCGGITREQWRRLDQFEGEYYRRILVPVVTSYSDNQLAWAYVIRGHFLTILTDEPWVMAQFQNRFLNRLCTTSKPTY